MEQQLGAGADGSLWRAVDETLQRQVSLRVVRAGHPFGADVVDAARRAALVDDARLARVLDVGESDGITYIVTEYVQGRLFEDYLREGPLPAESVRRIIGEIAEALDRAGMRGLHHLRLSPATVCIVPDGSVKLLGTAIEAAAAGAEPDQADVASRQDAVGLISLVYAGLTGRWPGVADGPLGPAPRVTGRAVPPGDLAAGVPGDLNTLCVVTLGPGDDGPRSPGEVAEQLSPWAAASPLTEPRGIELSAPERPPAPRAEPVQDAARAAGRAGEERSAVAVAVAGEPEGEVPGSANGQDPRVTAGRASGPVASEAPAGTVPAGKVPAGKVPAGKVPASDPAPEEADAQGDAAAPGEPAGVTARPATPAAAPAPPATPPDEVVAPDTNAIPIAAVASEVITLPSTPTDHREPFPVRNAGLQPPLMQAQAFPVPADRPGSHRLSEAGHAWPTPPTASRTSVATDPETPVRPMSRLGDDILGSSGVPGVRRLDPAPPPMLGQSARPGPPSGWGSGPDDDRLGPFMPPVPIDRPPQGQARMVLGLIAGLVVLGLVFSLFALRGVMSADPLTPRSSRTQASGDPVATSAPAAVPQVTGGLVDIAGVKVLDPQGDKIENDAAAPRLIDGDSATEWRSERYDTAKFGGLSKSGIGFVVDLGEVATVTQVVVEHRGSGGVMELRTATAPNLDASTMVSTVPMEGNRLTMTLQQPVTTRYLVLWFTTLTKQSTGEFRLRVFEVSVR